MSRVTRERFTAREPDLVEVEPAATAAGLAGFSSPYLDELLAISKALSPTSSSRPPLSALTIRGLLHRSGLVVAGQETLRAAHSGGPLPPAPRNHYESEAEWLVVSMATVQTYGILMRTCLDQIIPLDDHIWYWDEVLGSSTNLSLYTLQTSPSRLWSKILDVKDAVSDARAQLGRFRDGPVDALESGRAGLAERWHDFYGIVRRSVAERSLHDIQARVLSPVARCRADALQRRANLHRTRLRLSSTLGILIDEGLRFGLNEDADISKLDAEQGRPWKAVVERSVSLMSQVTKSVVHYEEPISQFEDAIFTDVEEDDLLAATGDDNSDQPGRLAHRLDFILKRAIPRYEGDLSKAVVEHGRPSRLVRYWLPAGVLLLSSTTVLRIAAHRKAEIVQWIQELGTTAKDFWFNWVVEPVGRVIKTIRHDSESEIALMSRDSLRADRDSLERMVVEFARDKPQAAVGSSSITESQLADIRAKVKEGDVTPVLRAYENDLRKPFVGAVKGDLVRSLLIQVQKTKVDLEVAIGGIDALLRSQELVFGFVGLTPGVLVSVVVLQYLYGTLGNRKGNGKGRRAGRVIRVLRNIDRIFYEAATDPATVNNILSYKHRGLLVCEVHVLRSLVDGLFPRDVEKDFLEDLEDVMSGQRLDRQRKALKRIRWAYAKWIH